MTDCIPVAMPTDPSVDLDSEPELPGGSPILAVRLVSWLAYVPPDMSGHNEIRWKACCSISKPG